MKLRLLELWTCSLPIHIIAKDAPVIQGMVLSGATELLYGPTQSDEDKCATGTVYTCMPFVGPKSMNVLGMECSYYVLSI